MLKGEYTREELGVKRGNIQWKVKVNDETLLLEQIEYSSYIYASLLTFIFAIIMQVVTYFKLKKIDMIEALKSVE